MQQLLLGKHIELSEQHIHQHRERQSAAAISPSRFDTLPENATGRSGLFSAAQMFSSSLEGS